MARDRGAWSAGRGVLVLVVLAALGWWAVTVLGPDDRTEVGDADDLRTVTEAPEVVPPRWTADVPAPAEVELLVPPEAVPAPAPAEGASTAPVGKVEAVEAPTATLRVLVVTPEGRPVEDAEVSLDTGGQANGRTDAQGRVEFEVTPGASVRVAARHEAFRFATARAVVSAEPDVTTDLVLALERALTVCVRIESHLGLPVAGARVGFRETEQHVRSLPDRFIPYRPGAMESFHRQQRFGGQYQETRVTGPGGRCCVSGVQPGFLGLTVEAPGFVRVKWHEVEVVEPGGDLGVIRLEPAATLHGLVLDAAGAAVPGALVESWWHTESPQLLTDDEGRFTLDGVPEDVRHIPLVVTHESRGHFLDDRWPVATHEQVVTLQPPLVARLRLVDAVTWAPLDGACEVRLLMPEQTIMHRGMQLMSKQHHTLIQGELDVDPVYAFGTALQLEVSEYARAEVPVASVVDAAGVRFEVALVREGKLSVRVVDAATGLPLREAEFSTGTKPLRSEDGPRLFSYQRLYGEFVESTGVHLIDMSGFSLAEGLEVTLGVGAEGYARCEPLPVSRDGVRVIGDRVEVRLERK